MLGNLFKKAMVFGHGHKHGGHHQGHPARHEIAFEEPVANTLPTDATPQFMAGFMFAATGNQLFLMDQVVACYDENHAIDANLKLDKAEQNYKAKDYGKADRMMFAEIPQLYDGLFQCD